MKKIFLCAWLLGVASFSFGQTKVSTTHYTVTANSIIENGMLSQKIYLQGQSTPLVNITNIQTEQVDKLPAGVKKTNSFEPDIFTGLERKKMVAFINIPAYRVSGEKIEKLLSFDLEITEQVNGSGGTVAQKPTTVSHSVLASGTWYKVAVPSRGIYKIDYNFLQSLGVNPGTINPANIRVYGNGGTVLPEKVSSDQPDDLIENAVYVKSSGSTFANGDYILFYANGPVLWNKDSLNKSFTHTTNYYENQSYYFLNFDLGPGKRVTSENATGTSSLNVTSFNDYALIDNDSANLGGIGKVWWGYKMNSMVSPTPSQTINLNLGALTSDPIKLATYVGNVNTAGGNSLQLKFNGNLVKSFSLGQAPAGYLAADVEPADITVPAPANGAVSLQFTYLPNGTGAAYIDYVRLNYRRQLLFAGNQLAFRDWETTTLASGENASYTIQNAPSAIRVWDITNPLNPVALNGTAGSGSYTVTREGHSLKEFIAFDESQFNTFSTPTAIPGNPIANQDLHGLPQTDFLIVTPAEFRAAAEDLANYHRQKDNITVTIVQKEQVYNEFSSGGQDIGGIRNFIKMFYDRATNENDMIKNVLFMGAASYDYKNRLPFNTNFVPTYETYESVVTTLAYSSDDYYALLDDGDDITSNVPGQHIVDVGTGRIPAFTPEEAANAVNKIKNYTSSSSFGPWKNVVTYVADDIDDGGGMDHMRDCEAVNNFYPDSLEVMNLYKIYSDAYSKVSTPSGGRYPMVNKAINDQIYNGTLLMSYSGHGSPERWSHEAILTADDYGSWTNKNKLPVMVTATCDFGRFDDPEHRSAGARLAISPNGGSIAMITTTQVVFAPENTALNKAYTISQFTKNESGNWKTLGEALADAKNSYPNGAANNHKYVVLGDPALRLAMPVYNVRTDSLKMIENDGSTFSTDTIKALGRYALTGSITDEQHNVIDNFNGPVYVTVFDKTRKVQTVNPERLVVPGNPVTSFKLQTNVVAKVKGTVNNGVFTVSFIAPKDINYDYGLGKISYYANTDATDAAGFDSSFTVGGYNNNAPPDNTPPVVKPYIDNEKFRDGGVTGPNPLLYVKLYDDNGINVSGNSVGHDLVAILDGDVQNPYVMNNYYETEEGDYRKGYVRFPLYNLPEGVHTINVRAWDVYNNSGEGTVTFEVKNKDKGFISDLYNYPNPVTDVTHFVFQHNQEGENMEVSIRIFTAGGQLVKTINESFQTTGNRTEITWDGRGERGAPLVKGVYFYQLIAKTSKGISAKAYQKLVLLR